MSGALAFNRVLICAVGLLGLTACGSVDQYGSRIYDANINSQDALNQEILLNIVRASRYQSANFMAISQVSGGQTEQLTTGLPTLSVGPGQMAANHVYQLSNSLQSTVQGGYQSNPLISTAFQNGMMTPISPRTVALLTATRPREIVFFLVVDGIDITQGKKHAYLKNDPTANKPLNDDRTCDKILADDLEHKRKLKLFPGGECSYTKFAYVMQSLVGNGLTADLDDASSTPTAAAAGGASASSTASSSAAGPSGLPGKLCFSEALAGLNVQAKPTYGFSNICGPANPKPSKPTLTRTVSNSIKTTEGKTETTRSNSVSGTVPPATPKKTLIYDIPYFGLAELAITMRSPMGVIDSLGDQLRDGPYPMFYASEPAKRVLPVGGSYLDVVTAISSVDCYTFLHYMGQNYCVPASSAHTPMIMDMVEALRNLNIQPADLNAAFTVRLSP